jgi:DNA polymerase-3 subunit epsilon
MKILGIILILGGLGGISEGYFISGILLIAVGYLLFKRKKKTKQTKEIIIDAKEATDNTILIEKPNNYVDTGNEFIVIDFETTGLSAEYDRIVEVAAIKYYDKEMVDVFHTLVNPKRKIPHESIKIHGITDSMVKGKPTIYDILPNLLSFIGDSTIVAHNARFDMSFLKNACIRHFKIKDYYIENKVFDTLKLSRKMFPDLQNHKLGTVARHIGVEIKKNHRSTDDALATAQIYIKYLESLEIEKQERLDNIDESELKCFEIVKNILVDNNRSIEYLGFRKTGKYFDIAIFYNFLRIKLTGKKHYIISDLSIDELSKDFYSFKLEDCPKSEAGKTRILIDSVDDLLKIEKLILKSYDETMESVQYYRKNVNSADNNIQEYLSTI